MHVFHKLEDVPADFGPTVVSIGNFDGVHRAHSHVLREIVERARQQGAKAIAVTFEPHPVRILKPDSGLKLITPTPEKLRLLEASGLAVGLPDGQMGNSEVGHLNLGAGAVVKQDLTRIDEAVARGELGSNPAIRAAFEGFERVHLIGLVSGGGVHSSEEHLKALIGLAAGGAATLASAPPASCTSRIFSKRGSAFDAATLFWSISWATSASR